MGAKIVDKLAPGIYRLASGAFRVKVAYGNRQRGGAQRETTFPAGTGIREMKGWQTQQRASLQRQTMLPVRGTLEADIPNYLLRVDAVLEFPKHRKYEIESWLARFGGRRRHTITRQEIRHQVRDWLAEGVAASTIRHRLSALSQMYVELDGEDASNPTRGVQRPKEPEPEPNAVPVHQIEAVLDVMAKSVERRKRGSKTLARALILTHTGMRPSQLKRMEVARDIQPYIDEEAPFVYIPRGGKRGNPIMKPLNQHGVMAFRRFIESGAQGKFSTSSFYKSWMRYCDRAGVPRFKPYRLRHSHATLLRRTGADLADVQQALGHKSPKTTARYAMVIPEKLSEATKKAGELWDRSRGQSAWSTPQIPEKKASTG
jgi:site-specific recombinase XerD